MSSETKTDKSHQSALENSFSNNSDFNEKIKISEFELHRTKLQRITELEDALNEDFDFDNNVS